MLCSIARQHSTQERCAVCPFRTRDSEEKYSRTSPNRQEYSKIKCPLENARVIADSDEVTENPARNDLFIDPDESRQSVSDSTMPRS